MLRAAPLPSTPDPVQWRIYWLERERDDLRARVTQLSQALRATAQPRRYKNTRLAQIDIARFILEHTQGGAIKPNFAHLTQLALAAGMWKSGPRTRTDYENTLERAWRRYRRGQLGDVAAEGGKKPQPSGAGALPSA